jgi:hypothetical protein
MCRRRESTRRRARVGTTKVYCASRTKIVPQSGGRYLLADRSCRCSYGISMMLPLIPGCKILKAMNAY